jgi:hypothetical protein
MFLLWFLTSRRNAINRRMGRPRSSPGGVVVELVALALILYGIVSIPWLIIPAAVFFALLEMAAQRQRMGRA